MTAYDIDALVRIERKIDRLIASIRIEAKLDQILADRIDQAEIAKLAERLDESAKNLGDATSAATPNPDLGD